MPERLRPSTVLGERVVQDLLLAIAHSPRDSSFINERLTALGYTADDLVKGGFLRADGGRYHIAFALFTQDDVRKIRAVVEGQARSLAADYLAHRDQFNRIFHDYPAEQVPALAYIVIGAFSLDWDGSEVAHVHKYATLQEDLGRPVIWAEERGELNLKGIYWGSHNTYSPAGVFTSFGDHYSLPRMALPDLYWRMRSTQKIPAEGDLKEKLAIIQRQAWDDALASAARMMFALHSGAVDEGKLVEAGGGNYARQVLDLLVELQYAKCAANKCSASVPVLAEQDHAAIRQARELSRSIIEQWLAHNYEPLRNSLSGITPVREGVPYPQVFTQIWHYVFGMTNGELVRLGFFADPYASSRKFKGFIPVVWDEKLVH